MLHTFIFVIFTLTKKNTVPFFRFEMLHFHTMKLKVHDFHCFAQTDITNKKKRTFYHPISASFQSCTMEISQIMIHLQSAG